MRKNSLKLTLTKTLTRHSTTFESVKWRHSTSKKKQIRHLPQCWVWRCINASHLCLCQGVYRNFCSCFVKLLNKKPANAYRFHVLLWPTNIQHPRNPTQLELTFVQIIFKTSVSWPMCSKTPRLEGRWSKQRSKLVGKMPWKTWHPRFPWDLTHASTITSPAGSISVIIL